MDYSTEVAVPCMRVKIYCDRLDLRPLTHNVKAGTQSDASTCVALRSVALLRITPIKNVLFELARVSLRQRKT